MSETATEAAAWDGRPPDAEGRGPSYHWLLRHGDTAPQPASWVGGWVLLNNTGRLSQEFIARRFSYVGPCPKPEVS